MKIDSTSCGDFGEVVQRLDAIVKQVRGKDTSLEHALDLFDEAIVLGGRAVDLVDKIDFTPEERARLDGEETSVSPDAASEGVILAASQQDGAVAPATEGAVAPATEGAVAPVTEGAASHADKDNAAVADAALQTDDHA